MLAQIVLRRAVVVPLLPRCARRNIPRYAVLARFNSTGPVVPPEPALAASKPSSPNVVESGIDMGAVPVASQTQQAQVDEQPAVQAASSEDIGDQVANEELEESNENDVEEDESTRDAEDAPLSPEEHKRLMELVSEMSEPDVSRLALPGRSMIAPLYHPKTHGIPAATIHLRSYFPPLLELFSHFAAHAASGLGIPISHPTPLPIKRNLWTVIRSPFVHKKSQENFERKTYKRVIKAWDADYEVVNRWVLYLEKNMLAGVGMRVVKWERAPVGVGKKVLDVVEGSLGPGHKREIQALGAKIVERELAAADPKPDIEQGKANPSQPNAKSKGARQKFTA